MPGAMWVCTRECHHHLITFAIIRSVSNTQVLVAFAWVARWFQWEGCRNQSFSHPSSPHVASGTRVYTYPQKWYSFLSTLLWRVGSPPWPFLPAQPLFHGEQSRCEVSAVPKNTSSSYIFWAWRSNQGMSRCSYWTHWKVDLSSSSSSFICSVVSNSLRLHGPQYTRLPCPLSPRVCSNSCPLSQLHLPPP